MVAAVAAPPARRSSGRRQVEIVAIVLFVVGGIWAIQALGSKIDPMLAACTMNGFGAGECTFTNRGFVPQRMCGHVTVTESYGSSSADSPPLCTGFVWPKSSAQQSFVVSETRKMCSAKKDPFGLASTWSEACSFTFVNTD
jgi:hypothetical protein